MAQTCIYPVTQELLGLAENLGCGNISLSTENRDWQGRVGYWDLVTLIDAQNVGFSVDSGEIVIRYFSDHVHFGEADFREAGTFLTRLLTCPLRRVQKYRGRGLAAENIPCSCRMDRRFPEVGGFGTVHCPGSTLFAGGGV